MINIDSRRWSRRELCERIGSLSQVGGITSLTYNEGRSKGVSALRVRTAAGLEFWISPDKGMDIVEASYLGRSLCWHSPNGVVHPAYYDARDIQWLKTFPGGLVATCGLTTAGLPSEDDGEQLGLHGSISNTAAEQVNWQEHWEGDDCLLSISGTVREVRVHGPNLLMKRTITTSLARRAFSLRDVVENQGFLASPLMQIYHLNFGFPLLTDHSKVFAPSGKVEAGNDFSEQTQNRWAQFERPVLGIPERVYYHEMEPDAQGKVTVVLVSNEEQLDFGIAVDYQREMLPQFIQWKMPGVNHFVLGLEPANCRVAGRRAEREHGTLQVLHPGETREFALELRVLDGRREVTEALAEAAHSS